MCIDVYNAHYIAYDCSMDLIHELRKPEITSQKKDK